MRGTVMEHKIRWLLSLTGVIIIASACNLFTNLFNPVDEVVSQIEDLADEVDIENIEEEIEALATELPLEIPDIGDLGNLSDLDDIGELEATVQAFQEGLESGELPPDIPTVDDPIEILFSSAALLTYTTPIEFEPVLSFYQEQMPEYGWEPKDDGTVIMGDTAILHFYKPDRDAIVTLGLNPPDGTTFVMVTIQPK
jgi:HAMP domain-containing protein